jgi:hypothetical protein
MPRAVRRSVSQRGRAGAEALVAILPTPAQQRVHAAARERATHPPDVAGAPGRQEREGRESGERGQVWAHRWGSGQPEGTRHRLRDRRC